MYIFVVILHVIVCFVLIGVILFQAGRGGGLSDTFGLSSTQTIFGAKANVFLRRATEVCAAIFLITCIVLGILTSRRGRSLIRMNSVMPGQNIPIQRIPESQNATEKKVTENDINEAKENLPEAKPEPISQQN